MLWFRFEAAGAIAFSPIPVICAGMRSIMTTMLDFGLPRWRQGAQIHTEDDRIPDGDAVLEGYLAYDTAIQASGRGADRASVDGADGLRKETGGDARQARLQRLCAGHLRKGIRPKTSQEAGAQAGKYKITARCCARAPRPGWRSWRSRS